ncbi:insulin-like 5a [Astyanax mexicanus]|uniref:Relaxin-3 n=2 Tax=Astyanax mexicanus TaxID=7994 RepID=A0A8B9JY04_ASTMX|nr:insulin-like 5a [Astyanax mexicanus]KAG9277328.1 relaxin-3 [Astyanax mexicanus]
MKALRSSQSLLLLMLLWAVCSVSQVQAEGKAVKLCGRDFIRAVVYTCGGSRWRRLLSFQDVEEFRNEEQNSIEDLSESEGLDLSARNLGDQIKQDGYMTCCRNGCRKSDLSFLC